MRFLGSSSSKAAGRRTTRAITTGSPPHYPTRATRWYAGSAGLSEGHEDRVRVEYLPLRGNRLSRILSAPLTVRRALRTRPDALYVVSLDLLPWAVLGAPARPRAGRCLRQKRRAPHLHARQGVDPTPAAESAGPPRRLARAVASRAARAATMALPATQQRFERAGVRSLQVRNFPPRRSPATRIAAATTTTTSSSAAACPQTRSSCWLDCRPRRAARRPPAPLDRGRAELRRGGQAAPGRRARGARRTGRFDLRYNVPFPEMQHLMARSRIGFVLYPSGLNYAERIPIRIFEYMAAGVPFVAADLPTRQSSPQAAESPSSCRLGMPREMPERSSRC